MGSSPIVTDDSVYIPCSCSVTVKLRRSNGEVVWASQADCSGGSAETGALYRDRVYTRGHPGPSPYDKNWTLDANTGQRVGENPGGGDPAFSDGLAFFLRNDGVLEALDVKTGRSLWTFAGNGRGIVTSPHLIDGYVYAAAADGQLWVFDPDSGAMVWQRIGARPDLDRTRFERNYGSFAAWDGILVIITTSRVVALESVSAEASYDSIVVDDASDYRP